MSKLPIGEEFWNKWADLLQTVAEAELRQSAVIAAREAAKELADQGISIDWNLINTSAQQWAEQYSYDLVKGINATSQKMLQTALSTWIGSGKPKAALIKALKPWYGKTRAEMIAVTETTRAYAEGNRVTWRTSGVEKMKWFTAEDEMVCPVCGPLADKTTEVEGNGFAGVGARVSVPPAHVRCRCYLRPHFEDTVPAAEVTKQPSDVPEFASGSEATKWLKDNWTAGELDICDISTMSGTWATPVVKELMRLANLYPSVAGRLKKILCFDGTSPNAYAQANYVTGKELYFNEAMWKKGRETELERMYNLEIRTRWAVGNEGELENVLTHEWGHLVQGDIVKKSKRYRNLTKQTRSDISRYAGSDWKETWAEGFVALHTQPSGQWTDYTKEQKEILEEVYGS